MNLQVLPAKYKTDGIDWDFFYIEFTEKFKDRLKSRYGRKPNQIRKFKESIALFFIDPFNKRINNHKLIAGVYRSISFGGDHRAIFYFRDKYTAVFVDVGNHAEIYK